MKFTISPPETPSIIDPNWKIEARFVGKTIERESERNPFGGLYPLGGEVAGVPVEVLRIDTTHDLMFKLHGGSAAELLGKDHIAVLSGPNGKMQFMTRILKINEKGN